MKKYLTFSKDAVFYLNSLELFILAGNNHSP